MKSICNRKIMAVWITATTMSAHNWYKKWVGASWAAITLILPQIVGWSCARSVCVCVCLCVRAPSPFPLSLFLCVCTSGAQGLLSIGSVWLNVKNCGFLPGASLSGSLPCLHFLNTPLFLNLLQVFGQDVKTHTGPGEQDFSPPHPLLSLPSLTSNLCPPGLDFFFLLFWRWNQETFAYYGTIFMWCVFCLDTSLLFNLRLFYYYYLWVLSGNGRRVIFPTAGGKTRLSQGLSSTPPPPPTSPHPSSSLFTPPPVLLLLVEVFAFFAEVGT